MKRVVGWAIANAPGMNVVMLALMFIGAASLASMRREAFPSFELEIITVTAPYPGATPKDCEEGICQKIEEAIRSIDGIKKITSVAQEGSGTVVAELRSDVRDVQKILSEIDREVNRIPSFPVLAEDPQVQQITFRRPAIRIGIIGPEDRSREAELRLREVAESVRDDVLSLSAVSTASIMGTRPYQIDVEIPEATLRSYGLSLEQVAAIIRERNVELPGGQLRSQGQEVLLRTKNKGRIGRAIAEIPLVTQPNGVVLKVDDLGTVRDEFEDVTSISEINGKPAMVVNVERTNQEDLLAMVDAVQQYVEEKELPAGYQFLIWADSSTEVRGRLWLLLKNGMSGLLLVFLVLTLFLEIRLAFWVALGIPISILGAGAALAWGDQTLNMLSLFSFLIALGIVVDDAIVIGENIYAHQQLGKTLAQAAIDGTAEVIPSVTASVSTTVLAFAPMFFVSGVMGKFMAVIPFAVIAMLVISLWESVFVLPCHLGHSHTGFFRFISILLYPLRPLGILLTAANRNASRGLLWSRDAMYLPALRFSLRYPLIPVCGALGLMLATAGLIRGGIVPAIFFPKSDNNNLQATIFFPDGTPASETMAATRLMEQALYRVSEKIADQRSQREGVPVEELYPQDVDGIKGPVRMIYREVGATVNLQDPAGGAGSGSHVGQILAELYDSEIREIHSEDLLAMWRAEVGEIPGVERTTYTGIGVGPGDKPIEFKLLAPSQNVDELLGATEAIKKRLAQFGGVYDIADDNTPGKWEFQFRVKDSAVSTGVTETDLGQTVRNTYFGAEVMRLQRGRHEVKLMVRYPEEERRSLVNLREIKVRTADGTQRPITELAEIEVSRGFSEINRINQMRSVTISADLDEASANAGLILQQLQDDFIPLMTGDRKYASLEEQRQFPNVYPHVSVLWEGQREQSRESIGSLMTGFVVAVVAMFVLLVLQFRSYAQPLLILAIIPFGMVGAVWGHAILDLPLTLFSMFGFVALAGVVINDSIVLIDFINVRYRSGTSIREALLEAGERRFRPIMLTSMTTIAGLIPLMLERSFQAKLLIPMAASLAFGLLLATFMVLLLIPVFYLGYIALHDRLVRAMSNVGLAETPDEPFV